MKKRIIILIIISIIFVSSAIITPILIININKDKKEEIIPIDDDQEEKDKEKDDKEDVDPKTPITPDPVNPDPINPEPSQGENIKEDIDITDVIFNDISYTYDGNSKEIVPSNIPSSLSYEIEYSINNNAVESPKNAGIYNAKLKFIVNEPDKYNKPNDLEAILTINKKSLTINDLDIENEFIYDKENKYLIISNLPSNLTIEAKYYDKFNNEIEPLNSGNYNVIFELKEDESNYELDDEYYSFLNIYNNLKYELKGDYYEIKGFNPGFEENTLNTPLMYENKEVKSISNNAFLNNKLLNEVILSNSINSIGEDAFTGCVNLMSVTLGSNLNLINKSFNNCYRLKEIYNYSDLNLEINSNTNGYIAKYASDIYDSNEFESKLIFAEDGFVYYKNDNLKVINYLGNEKNINIKSKYNNLNITQLDDYALYDLNLEQIILNNGLTDINQYALAANKIESIVFPNTIKTIDDYALLNSSSLKKVTLQSSIEEIGVGVFKNSILLNNINFNLLNIHKINDELFYGCESLTELVLPNTVNEIGKNSFYGTNIASLDISNVTKLNEYSFSGIKIKEINLNNTINTIPANAFSQSSIEEITIPSSVKTIDDYAFLDCNKLKKITLNNGLEAIGKEVFKNCILLEEIILPNTVTSLGESCFISCSGLKKVTLSNTLNSIPRYCFEGTAIKSINIPDSINTISPFAFSQSLIEEITIPNTVISLGSNIFDSCSNLKNATISANITTLPLRTFSECDNLEYVILDENIKILDEYVFTKETKVLSKLNDSKITIKANNSINEANIYYYSSDIDSETEIGNYWTIKEDEITYRIIS